MRFLGGSTPVIGTNPISIVIPTDKNPIIADMATSKRAWGEVREAKRGVKELPAESFYDKNGNFATDPNEVCAAASMGGYKGFAIGLLIEIMSGSFVDMTMSDNSKKTRGATILVMDPNFTVGAGKFMTANANLVDKIHGSGENASIPGDRSTKTREQNLQNGYLEIDDELWHEIVDIGKG